VANESYINKGTSVLFNGESGADVAFSMEGVANGAGRVSAQKDWGAGPRPDRYAWSCEVQFQATPTQGAGLELYIAAAPDSDSTQVDGDVGTTDAALGDVDMRRNLQMIGFVVSENAAASEKCVASGEFYCDKRYFSAVGYNAAGASTNATDTNFRLDIQPIYSVPGA
jgi:hypothetical protein